MRHGFLVGVFTVLGVLSIGFGVHHLHGGCSNRQAFERHVADICVQAAERSDAKSCASGANK